MTHEGLLVSEGYGRGMRYLLPQKSLDFIKEHNSNDATSDGNVATSEANIATSETNIATSNGNVATFEANIATSIKKKMSREELHNLIITNCEEWISLDLLSAKIERSQNYLRNVVIPVLIASKQLQMLYPGTPNHPKQQYKVPD